MNRALLDTVGLLALWNRSDQWHAAARQAFDGILRQGRYQLLTTDFVLLECGNAAARQPYRNEVELLRRQLEADGSLIRASEDDWQQAWTAYARGDADRAGIVDCISFVVMRRLGIQQAFTNDHHFRAAGFETLL